MSVETQRARARVPEGEPINTVARFAVSGRPLSPEQVTGWSVKVFLVSGGGRVNPRRPVYKADFTNTTGVFYDDLQTADGLLQGGYNFLHTIEESDIDGGHQGGSTLRIEYLISTTHPLASKKLIRCDVILVNAYST